MTNQDSGGNKIVMKKVIREDDAKELKDIIICFVREKGLTNSNLRECLDEVEVFMRDNAILEKEELK